MTQLLVTFMIIGNIVLQSGPWQMLSFQLHHTNSHSHWIPRDHGHYSQTITGTNTAPSKCQLATSSYTHARTKQPAPPNAIHGSPTIIGKGGIYCIQQHTLTSNRGNTVLTHN